MNTIKIRKYNTREVLATFDGDDGSLSFDNRDLCQAVFSGYELTDCSFSRCDMSLGFFNGCLLQDTAFNFCSVEHAQFNRSRLIDTSFSYSSLRCAKFINSSLSGCTFDSCWVGDFGQSKIDGCRFEQCRYSIYAFIGSTIDGCKMDRPPISMTIGHFGIFITPKHMRIGCQHYTHDQWARMTDWDIRVKSLSLYPYWAAYRETLLQLCIDYRSKKIDM